MGVAGELGRLAAFRRGLRRFLQTPLSPEECRKLVRDQSEQREKSFLHLLRHAVWSNNPRSPHLPLFRRAGVKYGDLVRLVQQEGIEATLVQLFDAGVYITLREFKRREAISRAGLEYRVTPKDFDNPLQTPHLQARTGGSRGSRTALNIDLDLLKYKAALLYQRMLSFSATNGPIALWFTGPPGSAGLKNFVRLSKLGRSPAYWFTPNSLCLGLRSVKPYLLQRLMTRRGRALTTVKRVPLSNVERIVEWVARQKDSGAPATLLTMTSSAVRVCLSAGQSSRDISGTLFAVTGQPLTPAKARIFAEAGCRVSSQYSMSEIGIIGLACPAAANVDEVHLASDKVAVLPRERALGSNGIPVRALYLTALHAKSPKIMLNAESGDYAVLTDRDCGCPLQALGFQTHLHTIRSYEKLTSDGMTFLGDDLLTLIADFRSPQAANTFLRRRPFFRGSLGHSVSRFFLEWRFTSARGFGTPGGLCSRLTRFLGHLMQIRLHGLSSGRVRFGFHRSEIRLTFQGGQSWMRRLVERSLRIRNRPITDATKPSWPCLSTGDLKRKSPKSSG